MRKILLPTLMIYAFLANAQATYEDSIPDHQLDEIIIEANMQTVKPNASSYIPDGYQKKSAQNAIDLLSQMAIPQILVNPVSNAVKTLNGKNDISLYINMLPATSDELDALRPEDVKRVEYLVHPTDPRYQQNPYVINFITRKQEFGGYAKLTGQSNIMAGSGSGLGYVKMSYKRMTYDFLVSDKYTDRHNVATDRSQVFRFPDNDDKLNEITRDNIVDYSRFQQNNLGLSFRAVYDTENMSISNTFTLDATNNPRENSYGRLLFTPEIFSSSDYKSLINSNVIYPTWKGNYYFDLGKGFQFNAVTELQYQRTKNNSTYIGAGNNTIINNAIDDAAYGMIMLHLNKDINSKNSVSARGYYIYNYDDVRYSGTSSESDIFRQMAYGFMAGYSFQTDKLYLKFEGDIIGERNKIGDIIRTNVEPVFDFYMQYAFNQKNSLALATSSNVNFVDEAHKTITVLKENELLYKTGNPYLKNTRWNAFDLQYTWMPNNKFQVSASGGWSRYYDCPVPIFTPTATDGLMLRSITNNGDYQNFDLGVSFTARLFNRSLILQAQPRMWFNKMTGIYSDTYNYLMLSASATYYFGPFYASVYYSTANRGLVQDSMNEVFYRGKSKYQFKIGWRNSHFNISASAVNIFRTNWIDQTSHLKSQYFDQYNTVYNANSHQFVAISASYTLGYGKQIQRGDEVEAVTSSGSAIMK